MNCENLPPRLRDICRGHDGHGNLSISPGNREDYLKLFANPLADPVPKHYRRSNLCCPMRSLRVRSCIDLPNGGLAISLRMSVKPKLGTAVTIAQHDNTLQTRTKTLYRRSLRIAGREWCSDPAERQFQFHHPEMTPASLRRIASAISIWQPNRRRVPSTTRRG